MLFLLVQDLLFYAQFKSGTKIKITCYWINLKFEIDEFLKLFYNKFEDKKLFLDLEFAENIVNEIYNDPNRIKQILMNLLSNALKFTIKGGVTIIIEEAKDKDFIAISVKDTGIGIAGKYKDQLFTEYLQIEKPPEISSSGVGLGLYKCKQLVNLLAGDIKFTSSENFGTVFTFTFKKFLITDPNNPIYPRKLSKQDNFPDQELIILIRPLKYTLPNSCKCSQILIVDDDNQFRKVLKHYSNKCEMLYDEAENGKKAIELVKNKMKSLCCRIYQKILLDYVMPDINGIDVAHQIKTLLINISRKSYKIHIITGLIHLIPDSALHNRNPPFDTVETKPILLHKFKHILGILDDKKS